MTNRISNVLEPHARGPQTKGLIKRSVCLF